MTISNFPALCGALCELMNVSEPDLEPDDNGASAIGVTVDGVETEFFHEPQRGDRNAHLLVRFGPLAEADMAQQALSLLSSNLYLRSSIPARFAFDEQRGDVVLLATLSLDDATPTDVYQVLQGLAGQARAWREAQLA